MSDRYVLDTSALLSWINGEPGSDRVRALLDSNEDVLLPWVALLEMYDGAIRAVGEERALERYAAMTLLPVRHLQEMSETLLLEAGRLKGRYRISLADALVAAHARIHDAILVHKDPEYEALAGELRLQPLPYKQPRLE